MATESTQDLYNFRASAYLSVAGFVVLLYDFLLTFADEVEYIWKARTTLPKILFLINRYVVPAMLLGSTYAFSGIGHPHLTDQSCRALSGMGLYVGILSMANGNFIVLLRLWVLWERRVRLVAWTLYLFVLTVLSTFGIMTWVVLQMADNLFYSPVLNACILEKRLHTTALWIPGVLFEVMIFVTTWYNALNRPRVGNEQLRYALYRDGIFYFLILMFLRISNLVLAITAPLSATLIGLFFIWSATTVTVSRLVLNLRRVAAAAAARSQQEHDEDEEELGDLGGTRDEDDTDTDTKTQLDHVSTCRGECAGRCTCTTLDRLEAV
ncbi:hypothetical protein FA95DRAFT_1564034 [Auriscalpium vulgare]|uniref:Uncharacterized protein n=1 Tax=Auriscalpium vulgare TaxID=40419 RepID=A0ACB8RFP1_9AGAM|nr:hypothetical protein FA95DRAFT_1564034 [Auriscalpium vulgare]